MLLEGPQIWYNALSRIYVIGIVYWGFLFSDCLWRECWSTSIAHHRRAIRSHYLINGLTIIWLCNHQNTTIQQPLMWCKLTFRPQEIWWKPAAALSLRTTSAGLFSNSMSQKKNDKLFFLSHLFYPPVSSRCDARAAVWRNPVCLQRGSFSRQPPTLFQLQLCLDRPAAGHWLRQLPVSTPTHTGVYLCKRRTTEREKIKQMADHAGRDLESCQVFSQDSYKPENNIWWCLAASWSKRTDWGWLTSIMTSWGKLQMFNQHPARKKLAGQLNCWAFKP